MKIVECLAHQRNLALYDLMGLIDTMERPSKLAHERPTNPDVKWVLLNRKRKSDESERVEEDIFD